MKSIGISPFIDASILTDHMMLEATELGLGSVWICFFKPDVLREEFSLPEHISCSYLFWRACWP